MGTTTPNIGLYCPASGETNYASAFTNGMLNLDTHDHSGGPNNGVPIASAGITAGSITRDKLNSNVLTPSGGLAFDGNNAIETAGLLNALFNIGANGILIRTSGTTAISRTLTGTANQTVITNGDGVSGNPTTSLSPTLVAPGSITSTTTLTATLGNITATAGDIVVGTEGNSLSIKEGSVASCMGSATLAAGTFTVATTALTANVRVFVTRTNLNASPALGHLTVVSNVGVGFTVNSISAAGALVNTDISVFDWVIIKKS